MSQAVDFGLPRRLFFGRAAALFAVTTAHDWASFRFLMPLRPAGGIYDVRRFMSLRSLWSTSIGIAESCWRRFVNGEFVWRQVASDLSRSRSPHWIAGLFRPTVSPDRIAGPYCRLAPDGIPRDPTAKPSLAA